MISFRELLSWGPVSCALIHICGRDWFCLWKGVAGLRAGLTEKTPGSWALRSEWKLSGDGELQSSCGERSPWKSREPGSLVWEVLGETSRRRRQGRASEPASEAPEL